jgi:hypothetical protein
MRQREQDLILGHPLGYFNPTNLFSGVYVEEVDFVCFVIGVSGD